MRNRPRLMKSFAIVFLGLAFLAVSAVGCCGPRQAFTAGVDALVNESGMLAEYEGYVSADPALGEESKAIRKATAAKLRALIEEAKKAED